MPFQTTVWTPVDNQKINQTQKSYMGSLDIMNFIAGQQRKYYFVRKSCGPVQKVTMDPQMRSPVLDKPRSAAVVLSE